VAMCALPLAIAHATAVTKAAMSLLGPPKLSSETWSAETLVCIRGWVQPVHTHARSAQNVVQEVGRRARRGRLEDS
jgi:hypothetical protein